MHSVKGLEFDHVLVVGLNQQVTPHGAEPGDSLLETHRRLLAMAVGRAKKSVYLSFKPDEASDVASFLEPATYTVVNV